MDKCHGDIFILYFLVLMKILILVNMVHKPMFLNSLSTCGK